MRYDVCQFECTALNHAAPTRTRDKNFQGLLSGKINCIKYRQMPILELYRG